MAFSPIIYVADLNGNKLLYFGNNRPVEDTITPVAPIPSSLKYILSDVSEADSGRTEDGKMWKMKKGQMRKLELTWEHPNSATISALLTGFDPEYFRVRYFDPKINGNRESVFYVGDRSAPLYNSLLDIWENVAFNIIERGIS